MNHSFLGFEMILGTQELRGLREREGDSDDDGHAHGHNRAHKHCIAGAAFGFRM